MILDRTHSRPTNILLIDDSITDLRLLMDMMLLRRYKVSVAFDGIKGYEQAVLLKPGLILLDVRMPTMDGFAVCRRLKANPTTSFIPVIFLTSATDVAERLEGFAAGGVDYIGKPFVEEEVLARVGVHLQLMPVASDVGNGVPDVDGEILRRNEVIVLAAQKLMLEQLTTILSLKDIARRVGTNRRQLNDAFQSVCGLPVFGWLREERLRHAHHLVGQTDTPMSMISEHLGYSTPANFTKAFRERYGCTPRSLRSEISLQRHQEDNFVENSDD